MLPSWFERRKQVVKLQEGGQFEASKERAEICGAIRNTGSMRLPEPSKSMSPAVFKLLRTINGLPQVRQERLYRSFASLSSDGPLMMYFE